MKNSKKSKNTVIIAIIVLLIVVAAWWFWKKNKTKKPSTVVNNFSFGSEQEQASVVPGSKSRPTYSPLSPILDTSKVLRYGENGAEVIELQKILNDSGAKPRLTEDGDFGAKTEESLMVFKGQKTIRLKDLESPKPWDVSWF